MSLRRRVKDAVRAAVRGGAQGAGDPPSRVAPEPQPGLRNLVIVVLDSCRWDSFERAAPRNILRLGEAAPRWSWASWTAPSHYNLLSGLLPHESPPQVYASEVYRSAFEEHGRRLGVDLDFEQMLPGLWLPGFLKWGLGYRTGALVSLPVLNPSTGINRDFDHYELMAAHNDFGAMLDQLWFDNHRPSFWLLNLGETHYPYVPAGVDPGPLPHLSGLHGAVRDLGDGGAPPPWFDEATLRSLHQRQVDAVSAVDRLFERFYGLLPPDTWVIVTADHGELFGEDGYFGHGPIQHDLLYRVPFVEGLRPQPPVVVNQP